MISDAARGHVIPGAHSRHEEPRTTHSRGVLWSNSTMQSRFMGPIGVSLLAFGCVASPDLSERPDESREAAAIPGTVVGPAQPIPRCDLAYFPFPAPAWTTQLLGSTAADLPLAVA